MPSDIEDVIKDPRPLDEDDYALLKAYGLGPYNASIRKAEKDVKDMAKRIEELCGMHTGLTAPLQVQGPEWYSTSIEKAENDLKDTTKRINELCGIIESDTGLSAPFQVARCTKKSNLQTRKVQKTRKLQRLLSWVTKFRLMILKKVEFSMF